MINESFCANLCAEIHRSWLLSINHGIMASMQMYHLRWYSHTRLLIVTVVTSARQSCVRLCKIVLEVPRECKRILHALPDHVRQVYLTSGRQQRHLYTSSASVQWLDPSVRICPSC